MLQIAWQMAHGAWLGYVMAGTWDKAPGNINKSISAQFSIQTPRKKSEKQETERGGMRGRQREKKSE